jgi:hypothetical protein
MQQEVTLDLGRVIGDADVFILQHLSLVTPERPAHNSTTDPAGRDPTGPTLSRYRVIMSQYIKEEAQLAQVDKLRRVVNSFFSLIEMHCYLPTFVCLISVAFAWPWVTKVPGADLSAIHRHQENFAQQRRQTGGLDPTCPFNPDHPGAARFDTKFPYTGSINGLPGTGVGGIRVPAPDDTAHKFTPPGPNDIRGPCPGLNAAANHNVGAQPFCTKRF